MGWLDAHDSAKQLFRRVSILKASHHGRKSGRCGWTENDSFCRDFLNWMDPDHVIISVGKKPKGCDATAWYSKRPSGGNRHVWTTRWHGTVTASYGGALPFDPASVVMGTRYERADEDRSYVQEPTNPVAAKAIDFRIGARRSMSSKGPFREEYYFAGRPLAKYQWLRFYVKNTKLKGRYSLLWRVTNTGDEARKNQDLRGRIESDSGSNAKLERTLYRGTHTMDCWAIQEEQIVGHDRMHITIR